MGAQLLVFQHKIEWDPRDHGSIEAAGSTVAGAVAQEDGVIDEFDRDVAIPPVWDARRYSARFPRSSPRRAKTAIVSGVRRPLSFGSISAWLFQTSNNLPEPGMRSIEAGPQGPFMLDGFSSLHMSPASEE